MTTTSLDLSKRLYAAFPEWEPGKKPHTEPAQLEGIGQIEQFVCPAYDLEFLLDRLPLGEAINFYIHRTKGGGWLIQWTGRNISSTGTTLTDAAGELALKLHEEGLL